MVPLETTYLTSIWDSPDPEQRGFYDSPPPRMDVSVCCLQPTAGSGVQHPPTGHHHHHHHHNHHSVGITLPVQQSVQNTYQYADQIVPDRGQPDGLGLVNPGQDAWQSNSTGVNAGITANTTTYIDYSWLQMQQRL
ncbi:uncharacterized protein LOC107048496 [Diachasma alloeum]|uniref:uncharacterized protein LOC107048496 n=1 Tax=Diachasma alloeum TaxID=454923 RepID=UPI0007383C93|nr:uncharacterized protein LOC107048496 [Diachasma alloeum]